MQCPKCEEGILTSVQMNRTKQLVTICDFCETLWFDNELIGLHSGHPFTIIKNGDDIEYAVGDSETEDQEHRSANYRRFN